MTNDDYRFRSGKTAEQIRNEFGIEKDLTESEETQIKNEFDIYCV